MRSAFKVSFKTICTLNKYQILKIRNATHRSLDYTGKICYMSHRFSGILTSWFYSAKPYPLPPVSFFCTCFIWRPLVVPSELLCGEKCLTSVEMSAVMSLVDTSTGSIIWTGGGGKEGGCATSWTRWWYKKTSNEFILKACWSKTCSWFLGLTRNVMYKGLHQRITISQSMFQNTFNVVVWCSLNKVYGTIHWRSFDRSCLWGYRSHTRNTWALSETWKCCLFSKEA